MRRKRDGSGKSGAAGRTSHRARRRPDSGGTAVAEPNAMAPPGPASPPPRQDPAAQCSDSPKDQSAAGPRSTPGVQELESAVVRFAGDSGDGMQVAGSQFTATTALIGNDLATLPDFPAEIRAPAGTLAGVSGFQIQFSSLDIRTPGDTVQVLVAMNPAALRVNLEELEPGGFLLVDRDAFNETNLQKVGYDSNPLDDGSLSAYRLVDLPLTSLTLNAVEAVGLNRKLAERCRNFFALGILFWLYDRPPAHTIEWIQQKFGARPEVAEANKRALQAGLNYANTIELFTVHYKIRPAKLEPGLYRHITGNEATALGFVVASRLAERPLFYGSYPITPASDILQELAKHRQFRVRTFQAEDEIAAVGAAIGASYGGALGLCGTSGPGLALKSEAIGLAVMAELPLVVANIQRAGPSTGMPTKTEQGDLLQAFFGRPGECPVAVVAPCSPGDCFTMAIEAFRIAVRHMTPVIFLSDGYLANGAEPWRIPDPKSFPDLKAVPLPDAASFQPYQRDPRTLARPWVTPGLFGFEHRIGGLEKEDITGNVSYDPLNHEKMVRLRAEKVARIADDIPELSVAGDEDGTLLVLGWGSTCGAIHSAVERARRRGARVSWAQLRHLNPFPRNLEAVLARYQRILVPELNTGQLSMLLRNRTRSEVIPLTKIQGRPFRVSEIEERIRALQEGGA
ncbi:MAG: 2-oxoacid:acceptor oxidoreductase subunit alpha [Acidobacteriota bacterium]